MHSPSTARPNGPINGHRHSQRDGLPSSPQPPAPRSLKLTHHCFILDRQIAENLLPAFSLGHHQAESEVRRAESDERGTKVESRDGVRRPVRVGGNATSASNDASRSHFSCQIPRFGLVAGTVDWSATERTVVGPGASSPSLEDEDGNVICDSGANCLAAAVTRRRVSSLRNRTPPIPSHLHILCFILPVT
jgi:hypothetical protein